MVGEAVAKSGRAGVVAGDGVFEGDDVLGGEGGAVEGAR
jgi:hypothetical protein